MELAKTLAYLREAKQNSKRHGTEELENVFFQRIENLELLFKKQQQLITILEDEVNTKLDRSL